MLGTIRIRDNDIAEPDVSILNTSIKTLETDGGDEVVAF